MTVDSLQLTRLIDAHAAALELFARQWTESAADVVQDAFLDLLKRTEPLDDPAAWLFRAVRNRAISAARSQGRRKRHEATVARGKSPWFRDSRADAWDVESLEAALRRLADDEREIVIAHVWGGLTFEQVGSLVGMSSTTAHRRYHAALGRLRQHLGSPCPTNEN